MAGRGDHTDCTWDFVSNKHLSRRTWAAIYCFVREDEEKSRAAHLNVYQLEAGIHAGRCSLLFFVLFILPRVENVKACGCRFFTRAAAGFCGSLVLCVACTLACKMLPQ